MLPKGIRIFVPALALTVIANTFGAETSPQQTPITAVQVIRGKRINLTPYVQILKAPQRSAEQRPWEDPSLEWQTSGFTPDDCDNCFIDFSPQEKPVWLRIELVGADAGEDQWILELAFPNLRELNFYLVKNGKLLREVPGGTRFTFHKRDILYRNFAWPLTLAQGEQATVYLYIDTPSLLKAPLYLSDSNHFFIEKANEVLPYGLYFGAALAILLYNFFLFLRLRDLSYLLYFLYGAAFLLLMAGMSGLGYQYLWPHSVWMHRYYFPLSIGMICFFLPLFIAQFLGIFRKSYLISTLIYIQSSLALSFLVSIFWIPTTVSFMLAYLLIVIGVIVALWLMIYGIMEQKRTARFLLLAFGPLLPIALVMLMRIFKWLPANSFVDHSIYFGSIAELLLLSLALSDRFKQVELERRIIEEKANTRALFFSAVGHDLRQPLGVILSYAEHLRQHPDDPETQDIVRKIADSARVLETILQDVMDFDRLESGRMVQQINELDIDRDLFFPLQHIFIAKAEAKGLSLIFENDSLRRYAADVPRLLRILMNLISNAIKYTEQGGILVSFHERRHEGKIIGEFSIRDSGIGIEHNHLDLIFQEYVRVGKYSNDLKTGVGLGLTIVKKLVQFLGGDISVDSKPGHGSVFTLRIPLQTFEDYFQQQQQTEQPSKDLKGLSVLALDDDTDQLQLLMKITANWNLKFAAASSFKEALEKLQNPDYHCDVVLLDWNLGSYRGLVVAQEIWRLRPGLSVIFVSGEESLSDRLFPIEVRSVISKPIRLDVLYRELWGVSLSKRGVS